MTSRKVSLILIAAAGLLILNGCQTTGGAIQGVGGVINKTGGAVKRLG